eukprot:TRINITY_DN2125_c0_g1_i2.p1 TRINITY_DN2125_c0_g1~~TRINITY_DN2125_c0_g1_i2.p1  ORF type:complete len:1290 (+),score=409.49 TRINITY_DN2125_c0_g1_i2:102-3971(+)
MRAACRTWTCAWLALAAVTTAAAGGVPPHASDAEIEQAKANLEQLKRKLAEESAIGWWPIIITLVVSVVLVLVLVPVMLWCFMPKQQRPGTRVQDKKKQQLQRRRVVRRAKWTLDDPTMKPQAVPAELRRRRDMKDIVEFVAAQRGSDSETESEEDIKKLTPEEIIRRHQQLPREPHVGIFLGVDDPMPNALGGSAKKHARCAVDARDMAEEFRKLDYKVFCLHDHSKQSDRALLPTRANIAKTVRNLKEGRYDDESRRKPNFDAWHTCLVYLATRVRLCKVRDDHMTLEFMIRQELEPGSDGVWIEVTELLNKIADIPQRQTVVMFDVVHTGQDDLQYDPQTGEDKPLPGPRLSLEQIVAKAGRACGLVDNLRLALVGCVRPEAMPKEVPGEEPGQMRKMRHGPFCHFIVNGFQDVEKNDPNREIWANMAKQGSLGLGGFGGGLSEMPAQQPVTVGDLLMCPFHCGDMTVDSTYRFLYRKMRLLTADPVCDPYYLSGSVKMAFAYQRAMRPREAPHTPCYLHECKREGIVAEVMEKLCPEKPPQKPVSVAICGPPGVGKTSLALAVAWMKDTMHAFHDGQFYFTLRKSLREHRADGRSPVYEMQMTLGHLSCGFEGRYPDEDAGAEFLFRNFMKLRCVVVVDDVTDPSDVAAMLRAFGVRDSEGRPTVIPADRWRREDITPKTALLITTTDPEVAAACDHCVEVGPLSPPESERLCAAAAGLLSTGELPPCAAPMLASCGQLPLFAVLLGVALRGQGAEQWEHAAGRLAAAASDAAGTSALVEAALQLLSEGELACLRSLAVLPPKRSVVVHALPTLWRLVTEAAVDGQRQLAMDHNRAHAVLARLLDLGLGRLIMEDGDPNRKPDHPAEDAFLLHPLVSATLRRSKAEEGDAAFDRAVIEAYICAGSAQGDLVIDPSHATMWAHGPWDGYYHQYMPGHLHAVCPELAEALYANPNWVKFQLDAVRVDRVIADLRRYGWRDGGLQEEVYRALTAAAPALRRHPWETLTQLYTRLCGTTADRPVQTQQFCIDLIEGSKPAGPSDKHYLWLKPLWAVNYFDIQTLNPGCGECLSVGFYKEWLVSGHEDGTVVLWNMADGTEHRRLLGHTKPVHGCLTMPDGRLATGSKDEGMDCRIRVWDLETGECEKRNIVDKSDQAERPPSAFSFKVTLGRTGFDPTNCEDCESDVYKEAKERIVTDTVLLEHREDSDDVNCFTFAGWDAATCCCSLTLGTKVHMAQQHERDGTFLVATADAAGRALVWQLQTTETTDPDLQPAEEEEEEVDRTIGVD